MALVVLDNRWMRVAYYLDIINWDQNNLIFSSFPCWQSIYIMEAYYWGISFVLMCWWSYITTIRTYRN